MRGRPLVPAGAVELGVFFHRPMIPRPEPAGPGTRSPRTRLRSIHAPVHPQPGGQRLPRRPGVHPRLRADVRGRDHAGDPHHPAPVEGRTAATRAWSATLRCGPCRPGSSAAGSTSTSPRRSTSRTTGTGSFAVWDGGLGIWGGIALGALVGIWRVRQARRERRAVHGRGRPGPAGGAGGRAHRQLLQQGAVRRADQRCPGGWRSRRRYRPARLHGVQHVPPDVPVRADLRPRARGGAGVAGPPPRVRPPGLFALYVTGYSAFRIFEESLRVDPSEHFLGLRLNMYVATILTIAGASGSGTPSGAGRRRRARGTRPGRRRPVRPT